MSKPDSVVAHPAATVVLLRDKGKTPEVLLVRRDSKLSFHGGAWVFPGGRIDPEDYEPSEPDNVLAAARHAAVREAQEEAGLLLEPERLVLVSRWITPEQLPKRFDAWFFVAPADDQKVRVDNEEIRDYRWLSLDDAMAARRAGEMDLPPPTFVTLCQLRPYATVAKALAAPWRAETYLPRFHAVEGGGCLLYHGDAAYEDGVIDRPGPRHRLVIAGPDWRYERS